MPANFKLNRQERKIVSLAALGGMLEFYDFIIYGIFSVYFAHQFFPAQNALLTIIESYVVFVLGYIARPFGGILFSHVGDEHGRKKVLIITIILMGASSLGIGVLPTYDTIGIAAPIGLLLLRLLQGIALGGELPSTYVYISETMPSKRGSGFGLTMVGVNAGLLLGMFINQLLNLIYNPQQLTAFGWRIPFIFGGALCIISYKIRKTLQETAEFNRIHDKPEFPLLYLFKHHFITTISGMLMTAIMSGLVVTAIIFMPTYLHQILGVDNQRISKLMPVVMGLNLLAIFYAGKIANYTPPAKICRNLLLSSIILVPLSYWLISHGFITLGVAILCILEGIAAMIIPLLVSSLFPTKIRLTGVAMSYNLGFTLFGGLAPIIISSAIKSGSNAYTTPSYYLLGIIVIAAIGLIYARKHSQIKID